MIDIKSLPLESKIILIIGIALALMSFVLFLRYTMLLILMKIDPEYREFVRTMLEKQKSKRK
jgi:uncharacterized membrane protein YqjE